MEDVKKVEKQTKMVKLFSRRPGDIVAKVGGKDITIKFDSVTEMDRETAQKLVDSEPGFLRIL